MGITNTEIWSVQQETSRNRTDQLAVEEPLEIRLTFGPEEHRQTKTLAITMRTPGQDFELVMGFLFTEGIIGGSKDVQKIMHAPDRDSQQRENIVVVSLSPQVQFEWEKLSRHFYTSSSCGVCGKGSIEMVQMHTCYFPIANHPKITRDLIFSLSESMQKAQAVFSTTGGIHAAGLFDENGTLLGLQEDVGRHNALDKLIGQLLRREQVPTRDGVLMVSGRASFELVQKASMAGIPIMIAVGAPSSLAVELARESGMTLIGFLRQNRFNIYSGAERIANLI